MSLRQSFFAISTGQVGERDSHGRAAAAEKTFLAMWKKRAAQDALSRDDAPGNDKFQALSVRESCDAVPEPFRVLACACSGDTFFVALHCGAKAGKRPKLLADGAQAANVATKRARNKAFGSGETACTPYTLVFAFTHDFPRPRGGLDGSAYGALSKTQKQDFAALQGQGASMQGQVRLRVEVWHMDEVQFDICAPGMLRGIVPVQRKATPREIAQDITQAARRKLLLQDLPLVTRDDAMVRWLALREGDVLRSERPNGTVYYRLVH